MPELRREDGRDDGRSFGDDDYRCLTMITDATVNVATPGSVAVVDIVCEEITVI